MVKYVHFTVKLVIGKLNACFNYKNKKITITMENKNNFDLYDEENIEEEEEIENQMRDISLSGFKLTSNEKNSFKHFNFNFGSIALNF